MSRNPKSLIGISQVDTPAFRDWFNDSKVVDASGKPVVVYHATNNDFSAFEIGRKTKNHTTFGDIETERQAIFASPDISFSEEFIRGQSGANIMPFYMAVKAPAELRYGPDAKTISDIINNSALKRNDFYNMATTDMWQLFDDDFGMQVVDALKKVGYDGAVMHELDKARNKECEVWVAFEPTQMKSVMGNCGAFSPTNPNICMSRVTRDRAR